MSIEFLLTTLVVVATPGTGALFTIAAGLSRGGSAAAVAAAGCTLGIVPHMVAAMAGVAALAQTSTLAFQVLKYAGVAYLLYMAWSMLRDRDALTSMDAPRSSWRVIVDAVLLNLLNPKLTIFFFAFLPQFVSPDAPVGPMLRLSAVFMLMTFVVFVGYGLFAAAVRDHVISRPRVVAWVRRTFAAGFLALGAKLAFTS